MNSGDFLDSSVWNTLNGMNAQTFDTTPDTMSLSQIHSQTLQKQEQQQQHRLQEQQQQQLQQMLQQSMAYEHFQPLQAPQPLQEAYQQSKGNSFRISKACLPCYNAKAGCDGARPCSRCTSSQRQHLCRERSPSDVRVSKRPRKKAPEAKGDDQLRNLDSHSDGHSSQGSSGQGSNRSTYKHVMVMQDLQPCCPSEDSEMADCPPISSLKQFPPHLIPAAARSHMATMVIRHRRQNRNSLLLEESFTSNFHVNQYFSHLFGCSEVQLVYALKAKGWMHLCHLFANDYQNFLPSIFGQLKKGMPFESDYVICKGKMGEFPTIVEAHVEKEETEDHNTCCFIIYFIPVPASLINLLGRNAKQ